MRNCIVDKSLKIIKLIKNTVHLILDNFRIVGFELILSSKYFILKALKRSFDPNVTYGPTGGRQENV
jgi:hypothetical protein